ncbi:MAG: hemerythrin family protein [Methylococcales bacterium]|nr:hemerythrin family protein [Methylococcales bacterium]
MENTNVLEYEAIPQVAMDAMNEVHRNELEIVNKINSAISVKDEITIDQLCQEWLEHTKAHFDRENSLMEKYSFPAYHCHHGEHVEALLTLESLITAWLEKHDIEVLATYVQKTWPSWYVNHISTMDTVTSTFIKGCMSKE